MNNQTIDGVPRALLKKIEAYINDGLPLVVDELLLLSELRAMLDLPACGSSAAPVAWIDGPNSLDWYEKDVRMLPVGTKLYAEQPVSKPELTVWYGPMPESNGKTNWTAMLHRKDDPWGGITLDRSEYPDRVRYEADRMRYMIGELDIEPFILDYDDKLHSGYKGEQ